MYKVRAQKRFGKEFGNDGPPWAQRTPSFQKPKTNGKGTTIEEYTDAQTDEGRANGT